MTEVKEGHEGAAAMKEQKVKPQPPCPECEKVARVAPKSQAIGDFLEHMRESGWQLARAHDHRRNDCPTKKGHWDCGLSMNEMEINTASTEQLLAEFFQIDLEKIEKERRALLAWLQNRPQP
ncbi:MAG: hypothetical protein RB191_08810 [Terriglobia bacterium]|nr:hypothetical protein [Terriglobia bacterium]